MKPLNKKFFGDSAGSIQVSFNDGQNIVVGYITKQISWCRYRVTADGQTFFQVSLAKTESEATALPVGTATIKADLPNNGGPTFISRIMGTKCLTTNGDVLPWQTGTPGILSKARFETVGVDTGVVPENVSARYLMVSV